MPRLDARRLFATAFVLIATMCVAPPARAATISLGSLSFDQFIAADPVDPTSVGSNAFNIFNSTGDFALPPDPSTPPNPIDSVELLNATLSLTDQDGTQTISIGTIGPGLLNDGFGSPLFSLQFADTVQFTSAVFSATLGALNFLLADGSTFTAADAVVSFTLAASGGSLVANPLGGDLLTAINFELNGDITPPTSVPEPRTVVLLVLGLGAAVIGRAACARFG